MEGAANKGNPHNRNKAKKAVGLRVLTLNVGGMRDRGKRQRIFHFLKNQLLGWDVIMLQETHLVKDSEAVWWGVQWAGPDQAVCDDSARRSFWSPSHSPHTGGTAILFNRGVAVDIEQIVLDNSGDGAYVGVQCSTRGQQYTFVSVYAPAQGDDRRAFISTLPTFKQHGHKLVMGGDWNCVPSASADTHGMSDYANVGGRELNNYVRQHRLVDVWRDLKPTATGVTRRVWGAVRGTRLDRFYTTKVEPVDTYITPVSFSDHDGVVLCLPPPDGGTRHTRFMANRSVVCSDVGIRTVDAVVDDVLAVHPSAYPDPATRWCQLKRSVGKAIVGVSKAAERQVTDRERELHAQLTAVMEEELSPTMVELRAQCERELDSITQAQAKGAAVRARVRYTERGEKMNSYFLGVGKAAKRKDHIQQLRKNDGTVATENADIRSEVFQFWQKVWATEGDRSHATVLAAQQRLLGAINSTIPASLRAELDKDITVAEAHAVLRDMRGASSPGLDGLGADVYKLHWRKLGPVWLDMINSSLQTGTLLDEIGHGLVVMLPKDCDGMRAAGNFRPITLLNVDYKLLAGIIARRLRPVVPSLVLPTQTGFVSGRYIGDNVCFLRDFLQHRQRTNTPGIVCFLDFEKAYDRVEWDWMKKVLEHLGFGPQLVQLVMLCYSNAAVKLLINGKDSVLLLQTRGVRQGCPLSPVLFVLCLEPMHALLYSSPTIKGATLPEVPGFEDETVCASLFADDVSLVPEDESDLCEMLVVVGVHEVASGAKLNQEKSNAVVVGPDLPPPTIAGIKVLRGADSVKSLGMRYNAELDFSSAFNTILSKVQGRVAGGLRRYCTVLGRVLLSNTTVASMAAYHAFFITPTDEQKKELDTCIWRLVWQHTSLDVPLVGRINRHAAQLPTSEGGLQVLSFSAVVNALQSRMVNRALLNKGAFWTRYFYLWLDERCGRWGDAEASIHKQGKVKGGAFWDHAAASWRKLGFSNRGSLALSYDTALATPVWSEHMQRHTTALRQRKGAKLLADGGFRTVGSLWSVGWRRWLTQPELGAHFPANQRHLVAPVYTALVELIQQELPDVVTVLVAPPSAPPLSSFWCDLDGEVGKVVGSRGCAHPEGNVVGVDGTLSGGDDVRCVMWECTEGFWRVREETRWCCGYMGEHWAGVDTPVGKVGDHRYAPPLSSTMGAKGEELFIDAPSSKLRRALLSRKVLKQGKGWLGRLRPAVMEELAARWRTARHHPLPAKAGELMLWARRRTLFFRSKVTLEQGGVVCQWCRRRGWEEHFLQCPRTQEFWDVVGGAFVEWHGVRARQCMRHTSTLAMRLGLLFLHAKSGVRVHYEWIWMAALRVLWQWWWGLQRREGWTTGRAVVLFWCELREARAVRAQQYYRALKSDDQSACARTLQGELRGWDRMLARGALVG